MQSHLRQLFKNARMFVCFSEKLQALIGSVAEPRERLLMIRFCPKRALVDESQSLLQFADSDDSLVGRLSLRLSRDWLRDSSTASDLHTAGWGRLSIWHEFKGNPVTEFSTARGPVGFSADLGGTWWEAELGVTREIDRDVFFYGNVGYAHVATSPKRPETLHYRGNGEFMVSGGHISRRSKFKPQNL